MINFINEPSLEITGWKSVSAGFGSMIWQWSNTSLAVFLWTDLHTGKRVSALEASIGFFFFYSEHVIYLV